MAKLDDLIQQKQQRDEDWKAKKTAEREELGQLSDDAVMRVTSEEVENLSIFSKEKVWILANMDLRRFLANPADALAPYFPPIIPAQSPTRAAKIM